MYMFASFALPVSVPLSIFIIRYRVQVREGNDVTAVRAEPLLIKATFPVLQLALVLVGDADVGVVIFHAHPSHSGMVTFQELMVDLFIMLHKTGKYRIRCHGNTKDAQKMLIFAAQKQ